MRKILGEQSYALRQQAYEAAIAEIKYGSIELLEGMRQNISISCLSERNDSILMWGHYANMHKGICVAYSVLEMTDREKTFVSVNYSDRLPVLIEYSEHGITRLFLESLRTKASDWEYEKEWRCIQDKAACGESWRRNGALLDVSSPKAIYLGCRSSVTQVEQMKRICFDLLEIPLYMMEQSKTEFTLLPKEIS